MKILEGIRVLDWTVLQQGSICSTLLGDLGADVIKIETPGIGDMGRLYDNFFGIQGDLPQGSTYYFEICNRNKRGMTLNLKSEEGNPFGVATRLFWFTLFCNAACSYLFFFS